MLLAAEQADQASSGGGAFGFLVVVGLSVALLWFVAVRPQRRRLAALRDLQDTVGPGDVVVLRSGLVAEVVEVDALADEVVVEASPGVLLRFVRGSVGAVRHRDDLPHVPGDVRPHEDVDDAAAPGRRRTGGDRPPTA